MFLIIPLLLAAAAPASDEAAVLATVQRLFHAMVARDAASIGAVLLPEARLISVRSGHITSSSAPDFAARISAAKEPLHERIRDPKILVDSGIAQLWAPYTFQRGDTFSHCGIDSVTLVKTAEGWKIASLVYTVEATGCPN